MRRDRPPRPESNPSKTDHSKFGVSNAGWMLARPPSALLFAILIGAASMLCGGCSRCIIKAEPSTFRDVVPDRWMTYSGALPDQPIAADDAYVFPSSMPAAPKIEKRASAVLTDGNGMSGKARCFRICKPCDQCRSSCPVIVVQRDEHDATTVTLTAEADALEYIVELRWAEFRCLQQRFNRWLLRQAAPGWPCDALTEPEDWVTERYPIELRDFWTCCLAGARFSDFIVPEARVNTRYPPRPGHDSGPVGEPDLGRLMGAIPLEPGMRLAIRWGGTAVYLLGSSKDRIARQTTTGLTYVDVVRRGDGVKLATLRHGLGGQSAWAMDSVAPPNDLLADGVNSWLPFGETQAPWGKGRIVPVFHDNDLYNIDALRSLTSPEGDLSTTTAPEIALLVPHRYVKADLARERTLATTGSSAATTDAVTDESEAGPERLLATLSRRYIIWGTDTYFRWPDDGPKLPESTPDAAAIVDGWKYAPLVFGNQTSVGVEIPFRLDGGTATYVALGTTWFDVLDTHARELVVDDPKSFDPQVWLVTNRTSRSTHKPGGTARREDATQELRFYGNPAGLLKQLEVRPADRVYTAETER